MKKIFLFFLLLAICIFAVHHRLAGAYLEPRLEKQLSYLFNMPVTIDGLRVSLSGHVFASRIIFMDQPEFTAGPHLDARNVQADMDLLALLDKRVEIGTIRLQQPFYFIDRIAAPEGSTNNVITWWRNIKRIKEQFSASKPPSKDHRRWSVRIAKIKIEDGKFIFQDRSGHESDKKFVFQELDGFLAGFQWPSPNPSYLSQKVNLRGTFGEQYPAPFEIHGGANFATSQVSFNFEGVIEEGILIEHHQLWDGSSIRILGGKFELRSRTICLRRQLQSHNDLILKSIDVAPGVSATDKIWGLPAAAAVRFLQEQETIHLKVPVQGKISDPQFGFHKAFRAAFQQALANRVRGGIGLITHGTVKLATHTGTMVKDTPGMLIGRWGRSLQGRIRELHDR